MESELIQRTRSEQARINGAKSIGPKTPEGKFRSQTARLTHGLYATRSYMLPHESPEVFAEIQAQFHESWRPATFYEETKVEQLVGYYWELTRLNATQSNYLLNLRVKVRESAPKLTDEAALNCYTEIEASAISGTTARVNARIAHCNREISRIERDLTRLRKHLSTSGSTQMTVQINAHQHPDLPETDDAHPVEGRLSEGPYIVKVDDTPAPEPAAGPPVPEPIPEPHTGAIVQWAQETLGFEPDPMQVRVMTESHNRLLVLAPRQTGKSTAAAIRCLYEAMSYDDATILLASASGRQSGQIMVKARKLAERLELKIGPPPPQCDGFSLENGAQIVALPDSESTIRSFSDPRLIIVDEAAYASDEVFGALLPMLTVSNGTIMLLSTPRGQSGYFYERWHESGDTWTRIFAPPEACPRVRVEVLETMRKSMSREVFAQEFECKFMAAPGQLISRETVRKCLRDDVPLFFPEYDLEDGI